jgi:hypothetical protein
MRLRTIKLAEKTTQLENAPHRKGCLVCGEPLVYTEVSESRECLICHKVFPSNTSCIHGHFICDECHFAGSSDILSILLSTTEQDPIVILQQLMTIPTVHMHGPEHHILVPSVLLTAYKNCGGVVDLGLSLKETAIRGKQVPGGACGNWGMCGAAAGAGIYASIVLHSTSLNKEIWPKPILLTSRCLERISEVGGPRCCKRTSYISIQTAIDFTAEYMGISMPKSRVHCRYYNLNRECLKKECPFFSKEGA